MRATDSEWEIIYLDLLAYPVHAWRPLVPLQHGMVVPR